MVEDLKKAQQYIQFEIDALEAEREEQKKQEAGKEPNNAYSVHPIIDDSGVRAMVVEIGVEKDADLDAVMRAFLSDLENALKEE